MLVLLEQDDVLLEKRPATGIWGGLWCFPQVESRASALELAARFGGDVEEVVSLPRLAHAFTHFALDIDPLLARLRGRVAFAGELAVAWTPLAQAHDGAVPVPVRRILAAVLRARSEPALFQETPQNL